MHAITLAAWAAVASTPDASTALAAGEQAPPPGGRVWLMEAITLDAGLDPAAAATVEAAVKEGLRQALGRGLVEGEAHLFAPKPTESSTVRSARRLLARGEELYLAFEFEGAAAALVEAAGLLTTSLPDLEPSEMSLLYRARLLEGITWLATGQRKAASFAFKKLLTIRLDLQPDANLASPATEALLTQVRAEMSAEGTSTLAVQSEPTAARVFVDGQERGTTPMTVAGLPAGVHGLRLVRAGYEPYIENLEVPPRAKVARTARLSATDELVALERLRAAAQSGAPRSTVATELEVLRRAAGVEAVLLVGLARPAAGAPGEIVVTTLLARPDGTSDSAVAALVSLDDADELGGDVARRVIAGAWPAVQVPASAWPLTLDFEGALLGVGPTFGREPVSAVRRLVGQWWFWAGVGAVASSFVAGVIVARQEDDVHRSARFSLDLTP
jgi:hypothetical protein